MPYPDDRKTRPPNIASEIEAMIRGIIRKNPEPATRLLKGRRTYGDLTDGGGHYDYDLTDLKDTPSAYTGSALKYVRVNITETEVEFITPPFAQSVYLHDAADATIGGYKRWRRAIPTSGEVTLQQTGKSTDGEMLLGSWITSIGYPGVESLPLGEWDWHMYAHVDNATSESYLKLYVYKFDTVGEGGETELFNVTSADIDDLTVALQHFLYSQSADIALLETDRLVVKAYFYTTRPADVTMTLTYDGAVNVSHCHLPIAAGGRTIPGGADTQIQYNDDGVFAGDSNLTWDGSTLTVGGDLVISGTFAMDYSLDQAYDAGNTIDYSSGNGPVVFNFPDGGTTTQIAENDNTYEIRNQWIQANEGDILNVSTLFYTETDDLAPTDLHLMGITSTDDGTNKYLRWQITSLGIFQGTGLLVSNFPANQDAIHTILQTGATFNKQGDSIDFTVKSETHVNAFWINSSEDTISIVGTGFYVGDTNTQTDLLLADGSTNYITIAAPPIAADWKLTLPVDSGDDGEVLATDGSGNARWATAGPMYLQFNLGSTMLSADTYMFCGIVQTSAANAPAIMRAGSITGFSFVQTADLQPPLISDMWNIQVYVNGASVWSVQITDGVNENKFHATQVSGTDTVNAGDEITVFCNYVSGTTDLMNCIAVVEITFHD